MAVAAAIGGLPACVLPPPPARGSASAAGEVAVFAEEVNAHRRAIGCPPLEWDPTIAGVAQRHSEAMRTRGFYGHTDPEGRGFTARLTEGGVAWIGAAENIARTSFDAEQVLYLWLQSRGHRENIENCRFTHHGVGLSGEYWTHVFVTPDPRAGSERRWQRTVRPP